MLANLKQQLETSPHMSEKLFKMGFSSASLNLMLLSQACLFPGYGSKHLTYTNLTRYDYNYDLEFISYVFTSME